MASFEIKLVKQINDELRIVKHTSTHPSRDKTYFVEISNRIDSLGKQIWEDILKLDESCGELKQGSLDRQIEFAAYHLCKELDK